MLVRRSFAALLVIFGVLLAGCGGDAGPSLSAVKGVVKYNGKPVQGAAVTFLFESGQLAVGDSDSSGAFTLTTNGRPGAPLGKAQVGVNKVAAAAGAPSMEAMKPEDMQKMQIEMMKKGAGQSVVKPELPLKYQVPAKSGLTAEVVAGGTEKNSFEFNLVD